MHNDPKDLGLICLVKKRKIHFRILSDFRIQSWIFLKKRTLRVYIAWLNVIQKDHKSNEINSYHELLAFGERGKPENSEEELSEKSRV